MAITPLDTYKSAENAGETIDAKAEEIGMPVDCLTFECNRMPNNLLIMCSGLLITYNETPIIMGE